MTTKKLSGKENNAMSIEEQYKSMIGRPADLLAPLVLPLFPSDTVVMLVYVRVERLLQNLYYFKK